MKHSMTIPTIIMALLAIILLFVGYQRGDGSHMTGLKNAINTTLYIVPLLICAFIVAGMVQALLPVETVSKWVGEESGMRGILIGTVAGALSPGGPYVSFPIAAGMLKAGAGAGTLVAYLTGWSLIALVRLPMEVGILGWKLTVVRFACTFFFAPIAGLIAHMLFAGFLKTK